MGQTNDISLEGFLLYGGVDSPPVQFNRGVIHNAY